MYVHPCFTDCLETDIDGILILLNAASTTFSVSTMVLDRVGKEYEG